MKLVERTLAFSLICLLILTPCASAWDGVGHMAVAYVAYQHLSPATKTRANKLIRLNPDYHKWLATIPQGTPAAKRKMMIFMIAATWPDQIKGETNYHNDGPDPHGEIPPPGATPDAQSSHCEPSSRRTAT